MQHQELSSCLLATDTPLGVEGCDAVVLAARAVGPILALAPSGCDAGDHTFLIAIGMQSSRRPRRHDISMGLALVPTVLNFSSCVHPAQRAYDRLKSFALYVLLSFTLI